MREQQVIGRDEHGHQIDLVVAAAQDPPQIAESLRKQVIEGGWLDASADPDAEGAFWAGFQHGVRAYLVETEIGMQN
jgi:hypothetical protein